MRRYLKHTTAGNRYTTFRCYLFNWHVLDEAADDGPRLALAQIHFLHVQRVCIRVLLHGHDLPNAHVQA